MEGIQAEFQRDLPQAQSLYWQAWMLSSNEYEACIAAHYVAHLQEDPHEKFKWDKIALEKADAAGDERIQEFYPSLYLNMGQSCELLGNMEEAMRYYDLAAELGAMHRG